MRVIPPDTFTAEFDGETLRYEETVDISDMTAGEQHEAATRSRQALQAFGAGENDVSLHRENGTMTLSYTMKADAASALSALAVEALLALSKTDGDVDAPYHLAKAFALMREQDGRAD